MYSAFRGVFQQETEGQEVKGQSVEPKLVVYWTCIHAQPLTHTSTHNMTTVRIKPHMHTHGKIRCLHNNSMKT